MNTSKYLNWTCCIALVASLAQTPCVAADAGTVKNPTNTTHTTTASPETWHSLVLKVRQSFHVTDEEVEKESKEREKANKLHKHFTKPFPNAEEMKKGREQMTQCLQLAQQHIAPLEGLKNKETAYDLNWLVTCVGFANAVDAVAIATLFNEHKTEGHEPIQQLAFLRRGQVIAKRVDEQTNMVVNLMAKAFGTKDEKIQFKDENFKSSEKLHVYVAELQKAAAMTRKNATDLDAQILKLEKETAASK